ncbi:hypothetical protein [Cupriavidus necator]
MLGSEDRIGHIFPEFDASFTTPSYIVQMNFKRTSKGKVPYDIHVTSEQERENFINLIESYKINSDEYAYSRHLNQVIDWFRWQGYSFGDALNIYCSTQDPRQVERIKSSAYAPFLLDSAKASIKVGQLNRLDPQRDKLYIVGHGLPGDENIYNESSLSYRPPSHVSAAYAAWKLRAAGLSENFIDFRVVNCWGADSFYISSFDADMLRRSAGFLHPGEKKPFGKAFVEQLRLYGFMYAKVSAYHGLGRGDHKRATPAGHVIRASQVREVFTANTLMGQPGPDPRYNAQLYHGNQQRYGIATYGPAASAERMPGAQTIVRAR